MKAFYETRSEPFFIGEMTHSVFPLHVHGIVEMVYLLRGECEMEIDGKPVTLRAGDAAIAFPLVPHSFDELSEDSQGVIAIFPPDVIPEYAGTFHGLQPEETVLPADKCSLDVRFAVERLYAHGQAAV